MIRIAYVPYSRFGNHMFQYSLARLLSEKFNIYLADDLKPNDIITTTPGKIERKSISNEVIYITDANFKIMPDQLAIYNYIIFGFLQHMHFYKNDRELIKTFFNYRTM